MKGAWIKRTLFLLALFVGLTLNAQDARESNYDNKTVILPFASYTPETRLMVGGLLMHQFKPASAGPDTRASQMIFSTIYTFNKQLIIEWLPTVILPEEKWLFDGVYQYTFFPDNYWGIGPFTENDSEWNVEYRRFNFQQAVLGQVAPGLYMGPRVRWSQLSNIEFAGSDGTLTSLDEIEGAGGSSLPGLGFSIRWDKRNSITAPTENHFLELTALFYPAFLGATHPHQSWQLDARKYLDLRNDKKTVLALHFRTRITGGQPPFQELSLIGGREIMRGYYEGRFRDAHAVQLQAELRQHIFGRLGMAVFLASGEVWNDFSNFNLNNPKLAGGLGLRFNLNPEDTSNIRIDFGIARHGSGLYVTIGEAF